nr:SMR family transporter [Pseudarthrobacter sp. MM222]
MASFAFLAGVLRAGLALGVAYGIWAALGVILTVLLAAAIFGEPLTPMMLVGVTLVIGGVLFHRSIGWSQHARMVRVCLHAAVLVAGELLWRYPDFVVLAHLEYLARMFCVGCQP